MMERATTMAALIEARQLLPHGERAAMTLTLRRHDNLCLIGPDSTRLCHYLRSLAGVEVPQRGELLLFGRPLASLDRKSWREQRQHIGFVARNAPILSVLRGLDNVMLPALYHKRMSRSEAHDRAMSLIRELGCDADINTLPAYLSPQQRMQLAIARAVILEPRILFVESPFIGLSLMEQQPIYRYLVKWAQNHCLTLATHSLSLVQKLATQILFIGEQEVHHFDGWQALHASTAAEVQTYLAEYQQPLRME